MHRKHYYIAIIVSLVLLITYLHYTTHLEVHDLHNIFTELYYIPLLMAALVFRLKGAVLIYLLIVALYLPFVLMSWNSSYSYAVNKILHVVLLGVFGTLAGILLSREKKYLKQIEKERYLSGLGKVSTTIVHELKSPLVTILGFSRRIREGKGNIVTASQAITEAAQKMQMIVHDVLNFAKPVRLKFGEEDIRKVIIRARDSCKEKADMEGIILTTKLPADPSIAAIDTFHMERALVNVINNAIDASKKNGIVVISAFCEQEIITIRIKDYGSGMDKETLENIFIPFYTRKCSGTGIGMAIAKKIIEGHRGKISITSQPEKGAEIIITLPKKLTADVQNGK